MLIDICGMDLTERKGRKRKEIWKKKKKKNIYIFGLKF